MVKLQRKIRTTLAPYFKENPSLLEFLIDEGLIDLREAERRAIRIRVEELCGNGLGRCEAMEVTAQAFCCSYEKVRAAVYSKRK